MKKSFFRRSCLVLIALLFFISFGESVYALDNTTTIGSQTTDTIDAFYYSDQYMWKVSLFVAKSDTVNRTDSTMSDFYRIGEESVYLSPVSNLGQWVGGQRPKQLSSLLFSKENKVDTLQALEDVGGNADALNQVEFTDKNGVDILNFSSILANGKSLPFPPQLCDGYINGNGVQYSEYISSLSDVTSYFNNQNVVYTILRFYASQQGKSPEELVSNLEFTINGETRTNWNPEGILPKSISATTEDGTVISNQTNQVEWLIVYEPCTIVYTRDDSKWQVNDRWYNGYVMSATDFAVTQLTKQMDWRYDETRMTSWAGLQPDAWDDNSNREHVTKLSHLVLGNSVVLKESWYALDTGNGVDQNAATPYNRWTSEDELIYGGMGMSLWEKPIEYSESVNYDYNENTDIIYSIPIYSNINTTPGSELSVTFEINGETYTDTVIAPAATEVLSYFKWHTPEVDIPTTYDLKITISPFPEGTLDKNGNEYVHKNITVRPLVEKTPNDPKVLDELPDDYDPDLEPKMPVIGDDTYDETDDPVIKEIYESTSSPYYYTDEVTLMVVTNRATESLHFKNIENPDDTRQLTENSVGNGLLVSVFENPLDDSKTWELTFSMANFGQNVYSFIPGSTTNGLGEEVFYSLEMLEDPDTPEIYSVSISPEPDPELGFYYLYTDTKSPELTYTVYFNTDGGTEMESIQAVANTLLLRPDDPEKIGYEFKGWFKDNNFTDPWDFDNDRIKGVTTLYAKFEIQTFTVTFNNNGKGESVESVEVPYGMNILEPDQLTEEGYTQEGWFTDSGLTNEWDFDNDVVTSDMTLYANWTTNQYIVGFEEYDGTIVEDLIVDYNDLVPEPESTLDGYVLEGWFTDDGFTTQWNFNTDRVTEDLVLYAKWKAEPSIIAFEENDGSEVSDLEGVTDQVITDRTMPESTRYGYELEGWFLEEDFSGDAVTELPEKFPAGGLTYFAKWKSTISIISFEENGGSEVSDLEGVTDQEITDRTLPESLLEGYTLEGWFLEEDFSGDAVTELPETFPAGGLTYYAKWSADPAFIRFEENGGSEVSDLEGVTDQEIVERTLPETTLEDFVFLGWWESEDDAANLTGDPITELPETFPPGETIYYAGWKVETFRLIDLFPDPKLAETVRLEMNTRPERLIDPIPDIYADVVVRADLEYVTHLASTVSLDQIFTDNTLAELTRLEMNKRFERLIDPIPDIYADVITKDDLDYVTEFASTTSLSLMFADDILAEVVRSQMNSRTNRWLDPITDIYDRSIIKNDIEYITELIVN